MGKVNVTSQLRKREKTDKSKWELLETCYAIRTTDIHYNFTCLDQITKKVMYSNNVFRMDQLVLDVAMVNPSPYFTQTADKFENTGIEQSPRFDLSLVDIAMNV